PGAERLGGGLLGGKAAGIARPARRAAAVAAAALGLGEDAVEKALAKALDRLLDPADVDQVAADAEDHCACSSRLRRRAAPRNGSLVGVIASKAKQSRAG